VEHTGFPIPFPYSSLLWVRLHPPKIATGETVVIAGMRLFRSDALPVTQLSVKAAKKYQSIKGIITTLINLANYTLQCPDTAGWMTGRASGL